MTDGNGYDLHLKSFATPDLFLPLFTQRNLHKSGGVLGAKVNQAVWRNGVCAHLIAS